MIAIFPEIVAGAAAGDVERLAVLVRRYFGGEQTCAPRPSVESLMAQAGLGVRRLAMTTPGALLAKDERGAFTIVAVISDRVEEAATRFLLAHMLGHYLLDIQPLIAKGDWQVSGFRELVCPLQRYVAGGAEAIGAAELDARRDARADHFAAALLLPRGMVRRALEKLQDIDKVAAFFGVPRGCLVRRLQEIGLASPLPVNFLDAERRITNEAPPLEPVPATELTAPADGSMPRSYAASTYGATEKATRHVPGRGAVAPVPAAELPMGFTRPESAMLRSQASPSGGPTPGPLPKGRPATDAARPGGGQATGPLPKNAPTAAAAPAPGAAADAKGATRPAAAGAPPVGPVGMARLREIARKLDKGAPSKA